jgi:hypothetical protein
MLVGRAIHSFIMQIANGVGMPIRMRRFPRLKAVQPDGVADYPDIIRAQDLARSKDSGFSEHLTKPVKVEALAKALAKFSR